MAKSSSTTPAAKESPTAESPSVKTFSGKDLKKAREKKGATLEAIFKETRIRVGTLKALEEERFDDLPNAHVYVRGFIRCLALELDLDPDRVWRGYELGWQQWCKRQ